MEDDGSGLVTGADGRRRCWWVGAGAPDGLYVDYHDTEWGRPVHDEVRLFEKLCLEGFQAGLSWITVLRKRPAFREVFHGFDPVAVARMDDGDVQRLLGDERIIRHRGKIEATIGNARAYLAMLDEVDGLDALVWSYRDGGAADRPRTPGDVPASTARSTALSSRLKRLGWRFVGPTTVYAFMQSMGIVDDHLDGCWVPASSPAPRPGRADR